MSKSESLKATFKRLELQQKQEEEAEISVCEYTEKLQGSYFMVTRRCKLDGCSCANYCKADLVVICPVKKERERIV